MAKQDIKPVVSLAVVDETIASIPEVLVTEDDAFKATDLILKIRTTIKDLDEKRKERVTPANETVKIINADFNAFIKPLQAHEATLKAQLETYAANKNAESLEHTIALRKELKNKTLPVPLFTQIPSAAGSIRFKEIFNVTVTDVAKIPRKFLVPDIKAIQEAVDNADGAITIPGVTIDVTTTSSLYTN